MPVLFPDSTGRLAGLMNHPTVTNNTRFWYDYIRDDIKHGRVSVCAIVSAAADVVAAATETG
ncbi:hypothetical protein GCM10009092_14650 [Bowmanella denitrificans]|uniref:Uncharacterized protein n=1 Tax=Bowmanella denitrificans TaxID=366582 RepID=A0ABN0WZM7_9ALTE